VSEAFIHVRQSVDSDGVPAPLGKVSVQSTGAIVADRLRMANTHWTRMKGLLGTRSLEPGQGLWITPCRQVHMFFMRYSLDIVFLDESGAVVETIESLKPNTVSPKVAGAASVLELPCGTIARAGLAAGSRLQIDAPAGGSAGDLVDTLGVITCNIVLAAYFGTFALLHLGHARRTGEWATTMPLVAQETLLVVLFLARRRSFATSNRPWDWAVGIAGTFLPLFLRPGALIEALRPLGALFQIAGLSFACVATGSLGRSIGVVAGNRGLKTGGAYRWVRHPMYSGYILSYIGYVAVYPSWRNLLVVSATLWALNARAAAEEAFLAREAPYRDYLSHSRWRFFPYLY